VVELKDNSARARISILVFGLICAINIVAVISGYFEYELLESIRMGVYINEDEAKLNDLRQAFIGILQSIIYFISIVVFLLWFRRAYENLHILGIDYLEFRTNMAVWGFFIPVINLFRPFQIMKEIWIESQEQIRTLIPDATINTSTYLVGIWWGLFLLTNFIGNISFRSMFRTDTIQDLIHSTQAYIVSDFMDVPAALVTLILILNVSKVEKKLKESIRNRGGVTS
jgi:hypothetical protein